MKLNLWIMKLPACAFLVNCISRIELTRAFLASPQPSSFIPTAPSHPTLTTGSPLRSSSNNEGNDENLAEADRLKQKAEELRRQIREMEDQLGNQRKRNYDVPPSPTAVVATAATGPTLVNKRVLVLGANGRLGSMVCRYLLRNHPQTEVVAAVHYVGQNSPTARGYARLSYEVGAEDGIGRIGPAWSSRDERTATFEYNDQVMAGYNLKNLRIVECELLDPVQCQTIVEGCDAVLWCATDFNGNQPRAVASLDFALLFRAVSRPAKGRVEVEGVRNMLGALKMAKQDANWKRNRQAGVGEDGTPTAGGANDDPINFVLVSIAPEAYLDYETPFGSFKGIKQQGENIARDDFPSLSHTVLQLCRFEDNFVSEGLELQFEDVKSESSQRISADDKERRQINRRDAARCVVDALLNKDLVGRTVQVWTDPR